MNESSVPEVPIKKIEEKATDVEMVMLLIRHINEPCEDLEGHDIRDFYIREAKRILPKIKDIEIKKVLEDVVQKYSV